jgi:hypothetical protein
MAAAVATNARTVCDSTSQVANAPHQLNPRPTTVSGCLSMFTLVSLPSGGAAANV